MNNRFFALIVGAAMSTSAFAGGLMTNTNQNASFLRQMSQDAIIDVTGMYANPAGTAFLEEGFHLSLNVQSAKQNRNITTTFPLFQYNVENPSAAHKFHGEALAPVIPSFQLSYNWEKWSVGANFSIGGGGGKCEFDQGLGSFEALYAGQIYSNSPLIAGMVGANVQAAAGINPEYVFRGYSMNSYMKGRQYYFGLQLGATRKITDNLSAYLGLRGVYASCNYNGWVTDVNVYLHSTSEYAAMLGDYAEFTYKMKDNEIELNCDQTGFGITPIIGIDWKVNDHFNFAAKYEAPTKMNLKNKTEMNDYAKGIASKTLPDGTENPNYNSTLGQFADGEEVREDVPAMLFVGGQYAPIEKLRLNAGWHYYFDKQAKKYGDKQDLIDKNTMEFSAGVEFDACKFLTVSASWQCTRYRLSDEYMNDLSFNNSSNAIGLGVRMHVAPKCNIDLGYMQNMYHRKDVTMPTQAGPKSDHYFRTNRVFGVGVNLNL